MVLIYSGADGGEETVIWEPVVAAGGKRAECGGGKTRNRVRVPKVLKRG